MTSVIKFALLAVCASNRNCNGFFFYTQSSKPADRIATSAPLMALLKRRVSGSSRLFRRAVDRWQRVVPSSTSDGRSETDREGNKRKPRQESYTMRTGRTKRSAYPFPWNIMRLCINNVANWKIKSIYVVLQQKKPSYIPRTKHGIFYSWCSEYIRGILLHLSTSSMWPGLIRT